MKVLRWWFVVLVPVLVAVPGCNRVTAPVVQRIDLIPDSTKMVCQKIWDWTKYRTLGTSIPEETGVQMDTGLTLVRHPGFTSFQPAILTAEEAREAGELGELSLRSLVDTIYLSGPGETQNTAEFHDCQAFATNQTHGGATYSDGIFAIFAVRKGEQATSSGPFFTDPKYQTEATPAAQIFALAEYPPLGIQPGFNCLYLKLELADPADRQSEPLIEARMRQDGWREVDCRNPISLSEFKKITIPERGNLAVRYLYPERPSLTPPPGSTRATSRDPVPVVARWHWHFDEQQQNHVYGMGVWCGPWWCKVDNAGAPTPIEPFSQANMLTSVFPSGTVIGDTRQGEIPGWYDEQVLSFYSDSTLRVTDVVGTIIPDENLGLYDDTHFSDTTWLPVAKVALNPLSKQANWNAVRNPFFRKFNFDLTRPDSPLNSVSLCRGTWEHCTAEEPSRPELDSVPNLHRAQIHTDSIHWWAKLEGVDPFQRPPLYLRAARCGYDFQVAGTARWRWLPDDPGLWVRCIEGCCEVRGGGLR